MHITDFQRSTYIWETKTGSVGRFKVESILEVIENKQIIDTFFCLSSVYACNMYVPEDLFREPHYRYQAVFSKTHVKIFRTYENGCFDHSVNEIHDVFNKVQPIITYKNVRIESEFSVIAETVLKGSQLDCCISLSDNRRQYRFIIPIKHININHEKKMYQVETGPLIIFPETNKLLYSFGLGYCSFNNLSKVHFIKISETHRKVYTYNGGVEILVEN